MSNEKIASRSQLLGLAGMLAQHMPVDLSVEIAQEWADDPESIKQMLSIMRDGSFPLGQIKQRVLEVTIDPKRTVEEWAAVGKYDYANTNYTTAKFGQFLTTRKDATEPYKARVVAFCLGRSATIDRAKRIRARLNLKPIGFEHIVAVGEQHPELQRELNWLVNLDAVWVTPGGHRYVSCLCGYPGRRDFHLHGASNEWCDGVWFFGLSE
ncbi:MAG: hypothetical protein A2563_03010 [Candidatus Magasanikbacteria bacterium RIFOXYD1_FULL_40_23]|uniref:Uncharacterized protein n=1 Tax=Candidatus Magasanikbacteria bacterium RIFOXYD1_FULL_40_23 TaxID=1798705 RepID=A0A1F6P8X3_9BACT|nr:MAG: hypothetical protein A2563_03010 [Candidatus Magasanikbacteria bacterium RIFOXYD1_FULL_40_23]